MAAGRTPCPRGGGQEELPHVRGQRRRPRLPSCDGAGAAERSYPTSEARGRSREDPMPEGRRPRGATPHPRSRQRLRGATACPRSGQQPRGVTPPPRLGAVAALCWSSCEDIPHIQGKRNQSKMVCVARGHQRADRLNHNHRKLATLITQTMALPNSMKLSHALWGHPRQEGHGGEV